MEATGSLGKQVMMSMIAQIGSKRAPGYFLPPNPPEVTEFGDGKHDVRALLSRYRLGLALFVASIGMLFVGFSSAYVVRRGIPTYDTVSGAYSLAWEPLQLPIGLLLTNTLLLIGASLAAEFARKWTLAASHSKDQDLNRISSSMCVSAALALGFIAGQVLAWHQLRAGGRHMSSGARIAFFYVITGTHAFHALLGVLLVAWISFRGRFWSAVRLSIATDLAAWYLHSMVALWICLFCFLIFA